jgi:CBS domain-containing protein
MTTFSGGVVGDFMQRSLEVITPKATIVEAAVYMRERQIGSLLVGLPDAEGRLSHNSGIVTETDLIRKALTRGIDPSCPTADQIMTSPLLTITADSPMLDASHLMEMNQARYLCVSEESNIVGIISMRDLARYFVDSEGGPVRNLDNVFRPLSVLMRTTMETIGSGRTVLEASQMMEEKRVGSLLVIEAGEIVGIVTETDLVRKVIAAHLPAGSISVRSVMNYPLIQIDINHTIRDASRLMAKERVRHLAVTEEHKVVGLLSLRDLVKMVSVRDKPRFLRNT